ncbi:MAG TPA: ABC transporter ATP-binding protein [Gemmataceae bacterium]|nr:ABC transporter ATP-binding protein [Gemmataceae bacterium]
MNGTTEVWAVVPADRREETADQLQPGETLLASFEPDLDHRLSYAPGLIVLTDRRVLAREPEGTAAPRWQSWPLTASVSLRTVEHGGAGTLELVDAGGRLAYWRYTSGRGTAAQRLAQKLVGWRARAGGNIDAPAMAVCPSCGAAINAEDGRCAACEAGPAKPSVSALVRLAVFARPRARLIALGFVLTLASTTAGLVPPYLTMPLLDKVLIPYQNGKSADFSLAYWYLGGLVVAAFLAWVLDWGRLYVLARVSERISADLRARTYAHLQRLSLEFFGGKRTGDLIARVGNDTERLCNFLSLNLIDFGTDILMIVMTAIILLSIDPLLALAALCPFPLIVWMVYRVRGRLLRGYRQAGAAWGAMTSVLADTIPGIRVVKAFAQESREIERFEVSNERVFQSANRLNRVWSLFGPTVTLLTTGGLLVVWAFAIWRVSHPPYITVGVLTAFLAYIARFYTRIESMIRMVSAVQRASASAQRIFEILDKSTSVPEPVRPIHPGRLSGRIELRGVRFKYGAREVLHGLDLTVEPGEMIGLVGPSGAGKSTLINLICRFYDVSAGAIFVDGADVRSFPVEEYRHNIGIVLQDPFLFYGTIAENIAYGRPDASRAEIIAAARAARAHEFILRLPCGYDSLVGERGQSLSGGERQRISIARALLINPRILILDEATSSVDTETEREIQAALENLIRGRTTIAIAHRLSTLRRANRLVVVESGRIAEIGRHDELLGARGSYARLHQAQMELVTGGSANGT